MAELTWHKREMPVLEAIFVAEEEEDEEGFNSVSVAGIAQRVEADVNEVRRTVRALAEAGFVTGFDASTGSGWDLFGIRLLERGRRAVGQWPTDDPYDQLVKFLQAEIDEEADPERKNRLKKLLFTFTDVGKDVAGAVLASWFRQMLGLQ